MNLNLNAAFSLGEKAWPNLAVNEADFRAFAAKGVATEQAASRCYEDLFLACACANGVAGALEAFEARMMPAVDTALARVDSSAAFIDEVRQAVRQRLFLGASPKISEYSGYGSLAGWLRTVALRVALNLKARVTPVPSGDDETVFAVLDLSQDVELAHIKAQYRAEFKAAFEQTFHALSARDRTVLRLNCLDGLNIEQIGTLYGTHRATAARWIAGARDMLGRGTRDALRSRLRLNDSELESMVGLISSQLDVSLPRLLADDAANPKSGPSSL